jgi:L-fuculose-phosphate aldolase
VSPRADVLTAAREMWRRRLVVGTSGNVSARQGELIHITPSALPYEDMREDDLVTLTAEGRVVAGEREPSSERRLHLAVYAARPDALALVHTHSVHATAWSFLGEPLDTGTEELQHAVGGPVFTACHAPSGSDQIGRAAVEAIEGRRAALLARHGVLALGATAVDALAVCEVVERQAQLAWLLRSERR